MYIDGLVSVVIPTYKRSSMLSRAINSAVCQTYKNIEVLVVDDNQPGDEYSKEVHKLIDELSYPQVRLITQPKHINGAAARNAGIRAAKGEYITFLDDDDLFFPTKIETQVKVLSSKDSSCGGVSCLKIFYKDKTLTKISESWVPSKHQSFDVMAKDLNIQTCTVLLRRKCLDETGYFNPNLKRHQEVQLMSYFTDKFRIDLIDEVLVVIDSSDLTNRPSLEKLTEYKQDFFTAIEPLLNKYSDKDKQYVYLNHRTELAWVKFRDINRLSGIWMLLKCFSSSKVITSFLKRLFEKSSGVNRLKKYDKKEFVLRLIDGQFPKLN